jgi:hypothetical protein
LDKIKQQMAMALLGKMTKGTKRKEEDDEFAIGAKVHYRLKDEAGGDTSPDFVPLTKELLG